MGSLLEVKLAGHEVDSSLPSSAKDKNQWMYVSAPPIYCHGMDTDNFIFFILYSFFY
jgi:hypothetical protein